MDTGKFSTYVPTGSIKKALMEVPEISEDIKKQVIKNLESADVFKTDNVRLLYLGAVMGAIGISIDKMQELFRLMESLYELD